MGRQNETSDFVTAADPLRHLAAVHASLATPDNPRLCGWHQATGPSVDAHGLQAAGGRLTRRCRVHLSAHCGFVPSTELGEFIRAEAICDALTLSLWSGSRQPRSNMACAQAQPHELMYIFLGAPLGVTCEDLDQS